MLLTAHYGQLTGRVRVVEFREDGTETIRLSCVGYAGQGRGFNNPSLDHLFRVGPLPRGEYRIGPAFKHVSKGPVVMRLTPVNHDAKGRNGFLIHGDNRLVNNSGSWGCIVLARHYRERLSDLAVTRLIVSR